MNSSSDRTQEFLSAVRSFQGRQLNGQLPSSSSAPLLPPSSTAARQSGDFMKIARSIGRDIAATFTKLEKLTLLARRKTLFDDRPAEIQELTFIIKEDMGQLNRQIGQLQQIARAAKAGHGKHQRTHSASVVVALQSRLAAMTSSFKEVLEVSVVIYVSLCVACHTSYATSQVIFRLGVTSLTCHIGPYVT